MEIPTVLRRGLRGADHVPSIAASLVRRPSEWRYVARWWASLQSSPIDSSEPWLPYALTEFLSAELNRAARVFEYGSGGSTLWFSQRVREVVSIEHDPAWYTTVSTAAPANVRVVFARWSTESIDDYVGRIETYPDGYFDLVVVDGRSRVECIRRARNKVCRGGLLVLDDCNRRPYRPAFDLLSDWRLARFDGLAPSKPVAAHSACWRRRS
jgi:hypothetical protein